MEQQPQSIMPADVEPPTKSQISQYMSKIGRKGGKLGGKRSLETMSASARSARAKAAVNERWARYYAENPDKDPSKRSVKVKTKAKPAAKRKPVAKRKKKKPARKRS